MIRAATYEDIPNLVALAVALKEAGRFNEYDLDVQVLAENLAYRIESPTGICLLADDPEFGFLGAVVGEVFSFPFSNQLRAHDDMWAVAPDHMGTGIGRILLRAFETEARRLGAEYVFVGAMAGVNDSQAQLVLEAEGFARHGTMMRK